MLSKTLVLVAAVAALAACSKPEAAAPEAAKEAPAAAPAEAPAAETAATPAADAVAPAEPAAKDEGDRGGTGDIHP